MFWYLMAWYTLNKKLMGTPPLGKLNNLSEFTVLPIAVIGLLSTSGGYLPSRILY